MSDHIKKIGLIGLGLMAQDYAKVLHALQVPVVAIGRSETKVHAFKEATEIDAVSGGIEKYLESNPVFETCIVAVDLLQLAPVTMYLLNKGVKNILLEKPGGMSVSEIDSLRLLAASKKANVYIAYNRRFFASVLKAKELIEADGGVKSTHFEFTEWSHIIRNLEKPTEVKENWMLANSSHVIDMAFYLAGSPEQMQSYQAGTLDWHSKAAVFGGAGLTKNGALFTYHANWASAGRWGVEVMTSKRKLILCPLEKLKEMKVGEIKISDVDLDDADDVQFKPGLKKQVEAFLNGDDTDLINIEEQYNNVINTYSKILI
jgi:predicted dehydrogenase